MTSTEKMLTMGIGTLATLLLVSCSQDSLFADNGANGSADSISALHIVSATLQAQSATRGIAADPLTTGNIGVFCSQSTDDAGVQNNRSYTYDISGGWQPQTADQTVYLAASDADICAYFPYNSVYVNKIAIPLASGKYKGTADDLTKHDPADICYATNRTMSGAVPSTRFEMNHAMSMVQLSFERDDLGTTPYDLTSVSIKNAGLIGTATLNIGNGTYTAVSKTAVTWTPGATDPAAGIQLPVSGVSETTSALLVPCTLNATGTVFTFTISGKRLSANVSVSTLPALLAGKIHRLKFMIRGSSAILSEVNIIDWQDEWASGSEPSYDGTPDDCIESGGVKWALSNLEYNPAYGNYNFTVSAIAMGTSFRWNALTDVAPGNVTSAWDESSDPCARLEPKGMWVTPTREDFAALYAGAGPSVLFPLAGNGVTCYWCRTYDGSSPVAAEISPGNSYRSVSQAYNSAAYVRCVKK